MENKFFWYTLNHSQKQTNKCETRIYWEKQQTEFRYGKMIFHSFEHFEQMNSVTLRADLISQSIRCRHCRRQLNE
ncbi:hypothetical protein DERP_010497 [Dermatophagoides pteronyssinus]|uniref:Yippee domain-containing protein n=1 Tax=Dermatophagoides pteronyssinus TaxID=6956 RepID=A0ABQ8JG45_DERPT|nr:hypothetical protein DERP_010497 [Dermatophagoides pteronyssinus]